MAVPKETQRFNHTTYRELSTLGVLLCASISPTLHAEVAPAYVDLLDTAENTLQEVVPEFIISTGAVLEHPNDERKEAVYIASSGEIPVLPLHFFQPPATTPLEVTTDHATYAMNLLDSSLELDLSIIPDSQWVLYTEPRTSSAPATSPSPTSTPASDPIPPKSTKRFNTAFLQGGNQHINIDDVFSYNSFPAGIHDLDVLVNKKRMGRFSVTFQRHPQRLQVEPCVTFEFLQKLGIDTESPFFNASLGKNACHFLNEFIADASFQNDTAQLAVSITVPQAVLLTERDGLYTEPSQWDYGINAGFSQYQLSARKQSDRPNSSTLSLRNGMNLEGFRFRNDGTFIQPEYGSSTYESSRTVVEHDITVLKSQMIVGDDFTNGEVFNGIPIRGLKLESDDQMHRDSAYNFTPVVQGIAQSNATVEIRQAGFLIYTENVPPGPFVLQNLPVSSSRGDIEMTIIEASGERRISTINYTSTPNLIRPGAFRYNLAFGEYRAQNHSETPTIGSFQATYGVSEDLTAYGGLQASSDHQSINAGAAFATPIGGMAIDVTHSKSTLQQQTLTGNSARLRWSKYFVDTRTSLFLTAQYYDSVNFRTLSETIQQNQNLLLPNTGPQNRIKHSTSLSVGQPLDEQGRYGNISMSLSHFTYWDQQTSQSISAGYGINIMGANLGVQYSEFTNDSKIPNNPQDHNRLISVSLAIPLPNGNYITTSHQDGSDGSRTTNASVNGQLPFQKDFHYSLQASRNYSSTTNQSNNYANLGLGVQKSFADISGAIAKSENRQQYNFSMRGAILAHSEGINFANQLGETIAIVDTQNTPDLRFSKYSPIESASNGYAIIPNVTPYRTNLIRAVDTSIDIGVDLVQSSDIVIPRRGSITKAAFQVEKGYRVRFALTDAEGQALPFGALVYDENSHPVGMTDPQGMILVLLKQLNGQYTVRWNNQQCEARFALDTPAKKSEDLLFETHTLQCTPFSGE